MRILKKQLTLITRDDALYFAGLFDGEGCVGLYERKIKHCGPGAVSPYIAIGISLSNTNAEVMRHIKKTCGGSVGKPQALRPKKDGTPRKLVYIWSAQACESSHILKQILPFLIVKRDQAELAIEFYESNTRFLNHPHPGILGKLRHSDAEIERRRGYVHRMKQLKQV